MQLSSTLAALVWVPSTTGSEMLLLVAAPLPPPCFRGGSQVRSVCHSHCHYFRKCLTLTLRQLLSTMLWQVTLASMRGLIDATRQQQSVMCHVSCVTAMSQKCVMCHSNWQAANSSKSLNASGFCATLQQLATDGCYMFLQVLERPATSSCGMR